MKTVKKRLFYIHNTLYKFWLKRQIFGFVRNPLICWFKSNPECYCKLTTYALTCIFSKVLVTHIHKNWEKHRIFLDQVYSFPLLIWILQWRTTNSSNDLLHWDSSAWGFWPTGHHGGACQGHWLLLHAQSPTESTTPLVSYCFQQAQGPGFVSLGRVISLPSPLLSESGHQLQASSISQAELYNSLFCTSQPGLQRQDISSSQWNFPALN